jgi:outer membrane receptor protein involved in Fe transport
VQADVSLLGSSSCGPDGRAGLTGRYTLSQALARLLAGAPCGWKIVDAKTVRIVPLSAPPRAQGPAQPAVAELLVTARRRPERLDVLPAGVSAISGEQLFATGAYDARDTAGQLVGVLTTNLGPGRDKLLMRGLSDGAFTGRARSTVSTYLDDAPINYDAPDPDLRLVDIQRVETLRGPQGALYGSGSLAGVYRIVANKPDPDRFSAGLQGLVSTTRGGSESYTAEGFANVPLARGRAALRLVGYYDDQGGYIDNVSLRLSNVDSTTRQGGRAALRVALSDSWTLDVSAVAQRLQSRDTQYVTQSVANPRAIRANQVREASVNNFGQAAATLRGAFAGADVAATTSYVQHDFSNVYDATAAVSSFSESGASLGIYSEAARIRRFVQDVVVTSTGSGPVSWLAGAYGSTSMERTPGALDIQPGSVSAAVVPSRLVRVYEEDRRDHLHEIAAYGEASWRFAPGWSVSAGARAFRSALEVKSTISGAPPTQPRNVRVSSSFSGLSPKLSVQYEFMDGNLVYALYSEGFRPGGVNSTNFLTVHPNRTTFKPDRLQNVELGAKGRFDDGRLVLRAAAFYDVWSDIQSDQYRQSGLAYTANVGNARIQGLEAEASYEPGFGLTLQANGLYSDAKLTRVNPDFTTLSGAPLLASSGLPGAPRWAGGALARYDRPLGRGFSLRLVAQASYVGPARLTFDPTLSARTDPVWQAGLLADLVTRRWTAGVFVTNPADAAGNTFAYGNPFTFGQVRQVTPQRPRTVGVRLAAGF